MATESGSGSSPCIIGTLSGSSVEGGDPFDLHVRSDNLLSFLLRGSDLIVEDMGTAVNTTSERRPGREHLLPRPLAPANFDL